MVEGASPYHEHAAPSPTVGRLGTDTTKIHIHIHIEQSPYPTGLAIRAAIEAVTPQARTERIVGGLRGTVPLRPLRARPSLRALVQPRRVSAPTTVLLLA